jgi:hypothetical protein
VATRICVPPVCASVLPAVSNAVSPPMAVAAIPFKNARRSQYPDALLTLSILNP